MFLSKDRDTIGNEYTGNQSGKRDFEEGLEMPAVMERVWRDLHERYPDRFRDIPQPDLSNATWDDLARLCHEATTRAGLTREDSDLILQVVREHLRNGRSTAAGNGSHR